jgi:two-component system cell cycle response regulator DivK
MSTILIVEDNERNLKLLNDVLELKGHRVLKAMTGEEGVRLAAEPGLDLILMDIQLPDIDGISALERIRSDERTARIPIVAVSASVMPEDQQRIVVSGFDAFVAKPINLKSFLETVARFLPGTAPSP